MRKIDLGPQGGRLHFHEQTRIDPMRVIKLIQSEPQTYRLDGNNKLKVSKELPDADSRFQVIRGLLENISTRDAA